MKPKWPQNEQIPESTGWIQVRYGSGMSDFWSDLSLADLPFSSHHLIFPSNQLMWKPFPNGAIVCDVFGR